MGECIDIELNTRGAMEGCGICALGGSQVCFESFFGFHLFLSSSHLFGRKTESVSYPLHCCGIELDLKVETKCKNLGKREGERDSESLMDLMNQGGDMRCMTGSVLGEVVVWGEREGGREEERK